MTWANKRSTPAVAARAKKYSSREHRQAREQYRQRIAAGNGYCWRCGRHIPPGSTCGRDWQTGHDNSGTRLMGPECTRCNRTDGAKRGAAKRNATNPPPWRHPAPRDLI